MSRWVARSGGARLEIYPEVMSKVLAAQGTSRVNALASEGAAIAESKVAPSARRFIGWKPAKRFDLRDDSQVRSRLSKMLSIPVALFFNNSLWAHNVEVGTVKRTPTRPLGSAFDQLRIRSGVRGVREARRD